MKRDMDLIRALLLNLEALPMGGGSMMVINPYDECLAVAGASADQIDYHLRLLRDEDFIDCPGSQPACGITFGGLTWAGHDFLDSIRDDDVWRKTKMHADKVGAWTLDILSGLAKAVIKAKLKALTGLDV